MQKLSAETASSGPDEMREMPASGAGVDAPQESWRPVAEPRFSAHYSVSDRGRVRRDTATHVGRPGRLLKIGRNRGGYACVALTLKQISYYRLAHRLVAEAFIGPAPPGRPHINHINGQRADNRPANLEWCSPAENMRHAIEVLGYDPSATVKRVTPRGDAHYNCKLSLDDHAAIKAARAKGRLLKDLATDYGISRVHVSRVLAGTARANP